MALPTTSKKIFTTLAFQSGATLHRTKLHPLTVTEIGNLTTPVAGEIAYGGDTHLKMYDGSNWQNIHRTGVALSTGSQFTSTLADGGASPFSIISKTKVDNLNVDQLDGYDASTDAIANKIPVYGTNGTLKVSDPLTGDDAANRRYVDSAVQGLDHKESVARTTTGNIALSGTSQGNTDGTPVAGERVLVKNQSTASENGIYIAASGNWTRATDASEGPNLLNDDGNFDNDSDLEAWNHNAVGTQTRDSGNNYLKLTNASSGGNPRARTNSIAFATEVGKTYKFSYTNISGTHTGFAHLGITAGASDIKANVSTSAGSHSFTWQATSETVHIQLGVASTSASANTFFDDVSIVQVELTKGAFVFVEDGSTYPNTSWVMSAANTWTQFSGAGQIVAGDGLAKTGDTLSVGVASPISIVSDNVTIADGAITGAKLVNNTVTSTQLADSISLTTLAATGSVTANGGFVTARPDNTAFLTMTQTGNETWSIAGRSGASVNDYLDIGTATGKISIGETGGLSVGDIALRDDDPIATLHVSTARYGSDLVTNGTMEADSNWTTIGTITTNERSTEQKKAGSYSRKLVGTVNQSGGGVKSDTFSIESGRRYTGEAWVYVTAGNLLVRVQDGNGADVGSSVNQAGNSAWTKIQIPILATSTGSSAFIKFYQNGNAAVTAYIDSVTVKEDCLGSVSDLGNDLLVNNNTHTGISIITKPQTAYARLFFGDSVTNNHASIYSYRTISTGDSNLYLEASNNNTPATILTLYGNDQSAKFNGGVGIGAASGAGGEGLMVDIAAPDSWVAKIKNSSTTNPYGLQIEANTNTVTAFAVYSANNHFKVQNAHSYFSSSLAVGGSTLATNAKLEIQDASDSKIVLLRDAGTTGTDDKLGSVYFGNKNVDQYLAGVIGVQDGATDAGRLELHTEATGGSRVNRLSIMSEGWQDHHANSTVNSATVQGLQDGACYYIGSTSDAIDTGYGNGLQGENRSYSIWVKLNDALTDNQMVFGSDNGTNQRLYVGVKDDKWVFGIDSSGWDSTHAGTVTAVSGKWTHVVLTVGTQYGKLYVDGVLTQEKNLGSGNLDFNLASNIFIGLQGTGTSYPAYGSYRDFKVLSSQLSALDVRKLYSGENPMKNLSAELWANGENFTGATGGTPPQSWTEGNAGTFTLSSGGTDGTNVLRINRSADNPYIYQTQTVVVGKRYLVMYRVRNVDATKVTVGIGSSAIGTQYDHSQYTSTSFTNIVKTITATTTTLSIYVQGTTTTGTQAVEIDYARVLEGGTLVDFNSQSASSTKWYNEAIPSLYNATVTGATLSRGNTYWNNIKQDGDKVLFMPNAVSNGSITTARLGIGISNPNAVSAPITLRAAQNTPFLEVKDNINADKSRVSFEYNYSGTDRLDINIHHPSKSTVMSLYEGDDVKVHGKLGIAEDPDGTNELGVNGTSHFKDTVFFGSNTGSKGILSWTNLDSSAGQIGNHNHFMIGASNTATNAGLYFRTRDGSAYVDAGVVSKEGNWGIGTNTPSALMHLDYGSNPSSSVDVLKIGSTAGSGYEEEFRIKFYSGTASLGYIGGSHKDDGASGASQGYLAFGTRTGSAVVERLRIDHDGTQDHKANRIVNSQTVSDTWRNPEPYLYFDNSNDYVNVSDDDNLDFSSDFSVEYWFKRYGDATGARATSVGKKGGNWNDVGWHLGLSNTSGGRLYFHGANGSGENSAVSTYTVEKEKWIHVVWTRKKFTGKVTLFVNGVEEFSEINTTYYTGSFANSNDLRIGVLGGWWQLEQGIKSVRLHNRVMTSDEIRGAYNGEVTPYKYTNAGAASLVDYSASVFSGSSTYSWNKYGNNTVTNVSNQLVITYVDDSQGAYHYLRDAYKLTKDLTLGKKYRFEFEAKYTGGVAGVKMRISPGTGGTSVYSDQFTTSMEKYSMEFVATGDNQTIFVALYGLASSNVVTIDNYFLYEEGEVAAWTPAGLRSSSGDNKWHDATNNALHGTITAAKFAGTDGHLGILTVKGRSEAGDDNRNTAGCIKIGGDDISLGRIDYDPVSTTSLRIDNTFNNDSAEIEFGMKTAGTRVVPLQILGDGTVKAGSASSTNLKQVARVYSKTVVVNTTGGGAALNYVLTHNLGTKGIITSVQDSNNNMVEVDVEATSDDTATFKFASATSVGSNENFIFTIMGGGAPEAA